MSARVVCTRCEVAKLPAEFRGNPRKLNGLSSWCLSCHRAASSESSRARREGPFPATCVDCPREFMANRRKQVRCPECQEIRRQARKR